MAKSKKKASKAAIISIVLSVVTALAVVFIALTNCFTDFSRFNRKEVSTPADNVSDTLYAPDKGLSITPTAANGIMLLSAPTPLADFAAYSLDENVEAVKTLTARFTPADTTLQKVDYTAAWKNSASSWATGKNVSDYLKLTQSSDGSLDCAVSALQAFGEQIIITCTARPLEEGDTVPSATCTVDYYKRSTVTGVRFYGDWGGTSEVITVTNNTTLQFTDYYYEDSDDSVTYSNEYEIVQSFGDGTVIEQEEDVVIKVSISENIVESIKTAAGITQLNSFSPLHSDGGTDGLYLKTELTKMLGGANNLNNHSAAIYSVFKNAYDAGTPALKFELSYTGSISGKEYNYTFNVHLNPIALGVKAAGLDLDKPSIVL